MSNITELAERGKRLEALLAKMALAPSVWASEAREKKEALATLKPLPCTDYKALVNQWKRAMKWFDGLELGLQCVLACMLSTESMGEQVWLFLLSPPSTGKTTLVDGMIAAPEYAVTVSHLTNLYSGYKADKEGTEDFSLAAKMKNRTLIVKDGDTLRTNPNREMILGQFRDIYDTNSSTHYGHGGGRNYRQRGTVIICGTGAMREVDSNDCGARFLTCSIMDTISDDFEDDVAARVANRAFRNLASMVNGKADERDDPAKIKAKQMTAGYLVHLRRNAGALLARVSVPEEAKRKLAHYAGFVSRMRARPSAKQEEVVERELSARLTEQICRLAGHIAAVTGRFVVDREVLRRVRKVALDTSHGKTLDIVRELIKVGHEGMAEGGLSWLLSESDKEMKKYLRFLRHPNIKVVERFETEENAVRYRLTPKMFSLFQEVCGNA